MPSREGPYKTRLKKKIRQMFPGCLILKNDPDYQQGIPDMLILFGKHWAMLEVKIEIDARREPNQQYWVEYLDRMSFSAFIYPENEEEVLHELHKAFYPERHTCLSQR